MKPNDILEIADKNGFDNFGHSYSDIFTKNTNLVLYLVDTKENIKKKNSYNTMRYEYSLADLACNKSFIESLELKRIKNSGMFKKSVTDAYLLNEIIRITYPHTNLQCKLIDEITLNNGVNFWTICSDFIGENNSS